MPDNMKFYQESKDAKAALMNMQQIAQAFAPEPLVCPYCESRSAVKINVGVLYADAFVMPYACMECTKVCIMAVSLKNQACTVSRLTLDSANEMLSLIDELPDTYAFMKAGLRRQRRKLSAGKN